MLQQQCLIRDRVLILQKTVFFLALLLGAIQVFGVMSVYQGLVPMGMEQRIDLFYGMIILAVVSMILRGWNVLDLLIVLYALNTYALLDYSNFAMFLVLVVTARGIERRWLVQMWLAVFGSIVLVCTEVYPWLLHKGSYFATITEPNRYNFMFSHCNGYGMMFAFVILALAYLLFEQKKTRWVCYPVLLLGTAFLWLVPKSKTAACCLACCLVLLVIRQFLPRICRILLIIAVPALIIVSVLLILGFYYGWIKSLGHGILHTFNMRFRDAAVTLDLYHPTWCGCEIWHIGMSELSDWYSGRVMFDFGHLRFFYRFGIIGTAVFYIIGIWGYYHNLRNKNYLESIMLLIVMIYLAMEWMPIILMFPLLFVHEVMEPKSRWLCRYGRFGLRSSSPRTVKVNSGE